MIAFETASMLVRVGPAWGRRGSLPLAVLAPLALDHSVTRRPVCARPRARRRTIPRPGPSRGLTDRWSGSVAVLSGRP